MTIYVIADPDNGQYNITGLNPEQFKQVDELVLAMIAGRDPSDDALMWCRPEDITIHLEAEDDESEIKTIWQGLNTEQRRDAADTVKLFIESDDIIWGSFREQIEQAILTYAREQL